MTIDYDSVIAEYGDMCAAMQGDLDRKDAEIERLRADNVLLSILIDMAKDSRYSHEFIGVTLRNSLRAHEQSAPIMTEDQLLAELQADDKAMYPRHAGKPSLRKMLRIRVRF